MVSAVPEITIGLYLSNFHSENGSELVIMSNMFSQDSYKKYLFLNKLIIIEIIKL